ncbi:Exocyst complex component 6 [Psilocybe cubensis]|uniref:Exocyst complex component SEC15 n=2 Tax=Psilocybe cubensis TaxID=181762 RepID=A0A8H7XWR2_PSICU|nr:Exocyst complex component 6 [Psilocybe cubensis]KAH9482752.1 Exocyst complex component 6 [Psilocybe cubensis]
MPPRRRQQFTQDNIDQQLQQIHLLDPSSSSENLEQLGPIIKQIHTNRQQDAYLRTVQALIDSKDAEIEKICSDNYQDFISSVSTLFKVKSYTDSMKEKITSLDASVAQLGGGLVEKKRALLQTKKTAANLDEAIDTLQACLRVLDVVDRVGEMIKAGKYWSALRSLEDIQSMPPTSLSQTPFFQHLLSSLPSLRGQIKDAVTASMKQWLLEIRNISTEVGRLAVEAMETRTRRWRSRREKDVLLRSNRVGSAVELVTYEKIEFNVLDNDKLHVDFKPLFECIHIYTTLNALNELQKSYQADRKAQSDLILPTPLPLGSLSSLTQEISGFFIVESHVLETTNNFRSARDVEELWDTLVTRLTSAIGSALRTEADPESFLKVKESLLSFIMTLEAYSYSTASLQSFILVLFEKYAKLLETQFTKRFEVIVREDEHTPMVIGPEETLESILDVVWLNESERDELKQNSSQSYLPWSQTFYSCCQDIRLFIQKFYAFVEGVSQHHRDIDELLGKSLDSLLKKSIGETILQRLATTQNPAQIAQIIANLEHFQVACSELERSLTNLRSTQRGGSIKLTAASSFDPIISRARARMSGLISSKLDQCFELSEYDWTPNARETSPSMYLYELVNWLTTVVDSLVIKEAYKEEAYKGALGYITDCLMDFLTGRDIPMMNENAISNILIDVDFLEDELKRIGRSHLSTVFTELRLTTSIALSGTVQEYLVPANRHASYAAVKPKRLQALLEKLARYGANQRDAPRREIGERRRKEAEAVGRLFPGENR